MSCIQQSPCIGLLCDETTDLSSTKALVIYAKTIVCCNAQTHLMALKELPAGEDDAGTVFSLSLETIEEYRLGIEGFLVMMVQVL